MKKQKQNVLKRTIIKRHDICNQVGLVAQLVPFAWGATSEVLECGAGGAGKALVAARMD